MSRECWERFPAHTGYRPRHASQQVRDARAVTHAGITNWWFILKSVVGKTFMKFPAQRAI